MKIKVKYFALLREAVGTGEETVEVAVAAPTVADVRAACIAIDARHAEAFASVRRIRAAVDGVMASDSALVAEAAEVAFFPPVTGG